MASYAPANLLVLWYDQVIVMEEQNGDFVSLPAAWNQGSIPIRLEDRLKQIFVW